MTGKPSYENTMLFVCYQYTGLRSGSGIVYKDLTLEGKERELPCASSAFKVRIAGDPWHVLASHDMYVLVFVALFAAL
jgi:hypothetical protein